MAQEIKRRPQDQELLQICVNLGIPSNILANHIGVHDPQFGNHYYTTFFYWS
jgi:hypothetical protein